MTAKKPTNPEAKYFLIENGGDYIMLFTPGSAFLYPGARAVVADASAADVERWQAMGAKLTEISKSDAEKMSAGSGILGLKE